MEVGLGRTRRTSRQSPPRGRLEVGWVEEELSKTAEVEEELGIDMGEVEGGSEDIVGLFG